MICEHGEYYNSIEWFEGRPIVYFIRDGLGHVKIGKTTNITNRIKALQTANPNVLEYYFGLAVKKECEAYEIEEELHEKFKNDRIRKTGEWFYEKNILKYLHEEKIELGGYTFPNPEWSYE